MRQIKFRGRAINGEFVYGLLTKKKIHANGSMSWAIDVGGNGLARETVPVSENSVAQLIGVDRNGNEVYEGDTLIDDGGNKYKAEIYDRPLIVDKLTLKEATS